MPFDGPANDTAAVLAKAEEYLQGGAHWMRGYWSNPEGRKCLLAAVKWAMLETAQPLHCAEKFLARRSPEQMLSAVARRSWCSTMRRGEHTPRSKPFCTKRRNSPAMPFDATPDRSSETRIIDKALQILGPNGENWIKGDGVDDKFCMLHALNMARHRIGGRTRGDETELRVVEAIRLLHHKTQQVPDFNDDPERTFEEVVAVLQLARTVKPSALVRKLYAEQISSAQLIEMILEAERKKAMAAEIATAVATIAIMLASVCIPA
jgi:hypothetical protein